FALGLAVRGLRCPRGLPALAVRRRLARRLLAGRLGGLGLGLLRRRLAPLLVVAWAHCILSIRGSARITARTVRPVWRTMSSIPDAPLAIASCTWRAIGSIARGARWRGVPARASSAS